MKKRRGALTGALLLFACAASCLSPIRASAHDTAEECVSIREEVELSSRFLELFLGKKKETKPSDNGGAAKNELKLCPGGDVFGVKITRESVAVVESDEECFLKRGDIIISLDGKQIKSLSDVKTILENSDGSAIELVIERGGERFEAQITPKKSEGGYKLGAVLRDGVAGIGTITYFDPSTGSFGGLGHGICEERSGDPVKMKNGTVTGVILGGVDKSEAGDPGELTGILTEKKIGELSLNTESGVFGKLNTPPVEGREALPVGTRNDVHEGDATIISTLKNGNRAEYKIEIFDIDRTSTESKSFKVRVKDEVLESITGGIVRGMSGSPIIQDGKLVGAVTHVMVANPTEGYGIFIENMLNAANIPMAKAS